MAIPGVRIAVLQRHLVDLDVLSESIAEGALAACPEHRSASVLLDADGAVGPVEAALHHLHDAALDRLQEAVVVLEVREDGPYTAGHARLHRERAAVLLLDDDQLRLGTMSRFHLSSRRASTDLQVWNTA